MPGWLATHNVPSAAVAYISGGKVAWTGNYGEQSPGRPANSETLYNIASLTKPVVAETILRLAAKGKIDLNAPMAPLFVDRDLTGDPRSALLTPAMALSHRLGFRNNWRREASDGKLRITTQPGTTTHYSGEGYVYAARHVMRATNNRLDYLARDEVFTPSGMTATSFMPDIWWAGRAAMVRGRDGSLRLPDVSSEGNAADDMHTTIGDYARFVAGALNGQGLTPEIIAARGQIYDNQPSDACRVDLGMRKELCASRGGYGLGWNILEIDGVRIFMHSGKDWGERTFAMFIPEQGIGLVVFTSGANGRSVISEVVKTLLPYPGLADLIAAEARFDMTQNRQ
jgi:CubicO group peptidase (beta-lactamase class C family)